VRTDRLTDMLIAILRALPPWQSNNAVSRRSFSVSRPTRLDPGHCVNDQHVPQSSGGDHVTASTVASDEAASD